MIRINILKKKKKNQSIINHDFNKVKLIIYLYI